MLKPLATMLTACLLSLAATAAEPAWQAQTYAPAPVDNPLDVVGNLTDALILGVAMIGGGVLLMALKR